ncbi:MAG: flagellar assembly protein FliW [Verrucomicrobiae bacterium]
MQINTATEFPKQLVGEKAEVTIPAGLVGLPLLTKFLLISDPGIYPFVILRHFGEEEIDFLAVDPSTVLKEYSLDVSDGDAGELGLSASGTAPLILNIAIIHPTEPPSITVNLMAPVLFNRETGMGKQILLENADNYSAEHPLDIEAL